MKDITPKHLRCDIATCPAIYEITPEDLLCIPGSCPGVHAIEGSDDLIVVGKRLSPELDAEMASKVGPDEYAVRIGRAFFANVGGEDGGG